VGVGAPRPLGARRGGSSREPAPASPARLVVAVPEPEASGLGGGGTPGGGGALPSAGGSMTVQFEIGHREVRQTAASSSSSSSVPRLTALPSPARRRL
jgi:hypothetical protein